MAAIRNKGAARREARRFGLAAGSQNGRMLGRSVWRARAGQATVEYLIVGLAIIAIIAALGLLANRVGEGLFVEHAASSASHSLSTGSVGSVGDVLLY